MKLHHLLPLPLALACNPAAAPSDTALADADATLTDTATMPADTETGTPDGCDEASALDAAGAPAASLQAAIDAAQPGDTVTACPGAHEENLVIAIDLTLAGLPGASLDGGSEGPALTVAAATVTVTGLDFVGGTAAEHLGWSAAAGAGIDAFGAAGLVVQDCTFTGLEAPLGAAVFGPVSGDLEVRDSVFTDNLAAYGAAVFHDGGASVLSGLTVTGSRSIDTGEVPLAPVTLLGATADVSDSVFRGNVTDPAMGGLGGGLVVEVEAVALRDVVFENNEAAWGGGALLLASSVELDGLIANGNRASIGGGALTVDVDVELTMRDAVLEDNQAGDGGGLFVYGSVDSSRVVIERTTVRGNEASPGAGGGIYAFDLAAFSFLDGVIEGNQAGWTGGGAQTVTVDAVTVERTAILDNEEGQDGGGGWFLVAVEQYDQTATFVDTELRGNRSTVSGGGIGSGLVGVTLRGCTLEENSSPNGGGVFVWEAPLDATDTTWGTGAADNAVDDLGTATERVAEVTGDIHCDLDGSCG